MVFIKCIHCGEVLDPSKGPKSCGCKKVFVDPVTGAGSVRIGYEKESDFEWVDEDEEV
jgi:hypothetical protein